jgi:hypothetical protein
MTDYNEKDFKSIVRRRTVKSFTVFFIAIIAGYGMYKWIVASEKDDRAYKPFRKVFAFNSNVFATSYKNPALAKEFPEAAARTKARFNGDLGIKNNDTAGWILKVVRYSSLSPQPSDTIKITLDELKSLPKTKVIYSFKCIEGWSQVTWWEGVRFSDFAARYNIGTIDNSSPDPVNHPEKMAKYCGLRTPDGEYYVGIDMPSMMHPQTILCYNFRDKPLPLAEGAPLRLIIPVKYGIKHLKRIGTIFFSDIQPPDYWGARGYDYYSGL